MPSTRARKQAPTLPPEPVAVKRPAAKTTPAKTPARKLAVELAAVPTPAKKAVAKKAAPQKTVPKKEAVKEAVARQAPAKKAAAPAVVAPKVAAKRAPAKKVSVPVAPAKKARAAAVVPLVAVVPVVAPPVPKGPPRKRPVAPRKPVAPAAPVGLVTLEPLPVVPVTPLAPVWPTWSEIGLQADALGQQLRWLPGSRCPEALGAQARALLDAEGAFDLHDDQGLLALQRLAQACGHELRVSPAVWAAVAACRDTRWRVHHLEQAYPEGVQSAALLALLQPPQAVPLAAFQLEGALFAACAGRCLLADEPGLGHGAQALAAAVLMGRHFGVERVLIVCPDMHLPAWQAALTAASVSLEVQLYGDTAGPAAQAAWAAFAPELVIVDDTAAGLRPGVAPAVRRLLTSYALVLRTADPARQPEALADWLAWLDPQQLGVSRRFLARHRDAAGTGWVALDRLRDVLAPVLLRRTRGRCLQPLPGRRDRLLWVSRSAGRVHERATAEPVLQAVLGRWHRVAYVSDQEQLALRASLASLQAAQLPPKLQALVEALPEWLAAPQAKVLVRAETAGALAQARAALSAAGVALHGPDTPEARVCLALDSQAATDVADATAFEATAVVSLDLPWSTAALQQRVSQVPGAAVLHLLSAGALDEQRLRLQWSQPQAWEDLSMTAQSGFLQGRALAAWLEALLALQHQGRVTELA